ncbi:sarcosine oxidase [Xylariomycetidae sp. FL0641]|nr:sarcosine oxidase [Xylariomycetidae sp. FL0641]
MTSYLILGAGVFGTSTALHLATTHPTAQITLVDRSPRGAPARPAASWDWNKVVRADYRDPVYCRLALEAQDAPASTGSAAATSPRGRGGTSPTRGPPATPSALYGGVFDHADYAGVTEVLVNRAAPAGRTLDAGIARARGRDGRALRRRRGRGPGGGGRRRRVLHAPDGRLLQAAKRRTRLQRRVHAPAARGHTAARTGNPAFRAWSRRASPRGLATPDKEAAAALAGMPVNTRRSEVRASNGTLPSERRRPAQVVGPDHLPQHADRARGRRRGDLRPPAGAAADCAQWDVPAALQADVRFARDATFGARGAGWTVEEFRMCWDCVTPTEDFIVSPHPAARGLFIATCGSFHGWKFFPIIGDYVVRMLDGTLDKDLAERWAWDRERPEPVHNKCWPRVELRDLS